MISIFKNPTARNFLIICIIGTFIPIILIAITLTLHSSFIAKHDFEPEFNKTQTSATGNVTTAVSALKSLPQATRHSENGYDLAQADTLLTSEDKNSFHYYLLEHKYLVLICLVISFLIIFILIFYQIKRTITPLENLKAGLTKMGENDFNRQIKSYPEHIDLINTFNSMSLKLGKRVKILETISKIDQLILGASKKETLIRILLSQIKQITPCFVSCFVTINLCKQNKAATYSMSSAQNDKLIKNHIILNKKETRTLNSIIKYAKITKVDILPSLFKLPELQDIPHLYAFPIICTNKLSAAIILGYQEDIQYSFEDLIAIRQMADHVAIALLNMQWDNKLFRKAHYDSLTRLPNRVLLKIKLREAEIRAKRNATSIVTMFLDFDGFKSINDSFGHTIADKYLLQITQKLQSCLREVDTLARISGDEFAVILPDLNRQQDLHTLSITVAEKLLATASTTLQVEGYNIKTAISIGITIYPDETENFEHILRNADTAMYAAKKLGGNRFKFFSKEMELIQQKKI